MLDQAEIHRKVMNVEVEKRKDAVSQLRSNFAELPDKEQAGEDLHRLTMDEDYDMRFFTADALGYVFQHIPDKKEAWQDLIRLTRCEDQYVRWGAARAIGGTFQHVLDKEEAWNDLHRLTGRESFYVRQGATDALGSAFQHVPDKSEAWEDLHRLTADENRGVRGGAARAIGDAFQHVPDKDAAWKDLIRMTEDEDSGVRTSANHSLGRASIFKATETKDEEDFKSELKNAIEFFERSSKEATSSNPSSFCLPFYRSFYSLTFEKAGAEGEMQKYLADAKSASEGSKNKDTLLEAVENLANALSEAQKVTDFDATKSDLKAYMQYCDRAADLIGDAAEGAPGAARVLRRGLPIIDDRIKEIIREIQEKAEAVCRETRGTGTPYEPLGIEVNKWAGELSDRDYLRNEKNVSRIVHILGEFCDLLPEGKRKYPCKIVEEIREESELEDKLSSIATAFSYLQPCIESQLQNAAKPTTDEHQIDHRKRTAIEILAAIAVSVLVGIVSSRYLEDLTSAASTVIAFIAFIILLMIILTQNRDKSI